ncbi:SGNH/GDSL hydrolase family protein [Lachnoclostridium sp. Marseille-P6806]|uniref:SGNH/GDSL hydrolase family protein n=1 Tax=Lachnoclostridium sp. Marseille-P6806 TaxID=2364793 RepID=UPI0010313AB9|nr:SGNH/GDSL hydrolase family protein [Lachnoclostridium sp. Marseille-P6806]
MTRKQWMQSALFLALFLFLLARLTYILRTNGDVKDRFNGFYAEPKHSIDAVMIGSSPVFPYYSTPQMYGETGLVCYPLSTNTQRPAAQLYLAKEALSRQSPELLIFEVRMYTGDEHDMTNNMAFTRGVTDNLRYSANRAAAIRTLLDESRVEGGISDPDKEAYSYYFDIFKYHANWRSLRLFGQWETAFYNVPDAQKGFDITDDVAPIVLEDWSEDMAETPIPAVQDECLTELMDWLNERGQQALFIVSPYLLTKEQMEMFNYIGTRVRSEGFGFVNMNREYGAIGLDGASDFKDYGSHTNASGAQKVTAWFERYLAENYDLPDRRGDARYGSWQTAYEQWTAEQAAAMETIRGHIEDGSYAKKPEEAE